jgi:hypothetical protein
LFILAANRSLAGQTPVAGASLPSFETLLGATVNATGCLTAPERKLLRELADSHAFFPDENFSRWT